MALFNGAKRIEGTRSHTTLVKSGHASPAEEWILDPTFKSPSLSSVFRNGVLFQYMYGGPAMQDVVVPMGRAVGVGMPVKDFTSGKYMTTINLPGMNANKNCVGIAPYNFTKEWLQVDRLGGNAPSIITQEYITLPYVPSVGASSTIDTAGLLAEEQALSVDLKNPWGAVIGPNLVPGDYLKASASGRLCKWDKATDSPVDVIGQILSEDLNIEPHGWEKWMLWDPSVRHEDDAFINRSGSSNLPSDSGYPYDPNYPEGNTTFEEYQTQYINNPTGVPGLHDGSGDYMNYGINDTPFTDMALGSVPASTANGTVLTFQLVDYAGGNVTNVKQLTNVKINGVEVNASNIVVNYSTGTFSLTITDGVNQSGKAVTATYLAYHFGIPTYLDFKGVAGAANVILLK